MSSTLSPHEVRQVRLLLGKATPATGPAAGAAERVFGKQKDVAQPRASRSSGYGLTPREIEILTLTADGLTNAEIAKQLYVSEETIKSHVRHCLAKTGSRSRTQAVAKAIRAGII